MAITALGESLNYIVDDSTPVNSLQKLFENIYDNLSEGGIFAFDIIVQLLTKAPRIDQKFKLGDDWAVLSQVCENIERNELTREIVIFRKIGENYRRSLESHKISIFNQRQIAEILENCGFQVFTSKKYGNYQLLSGRLAYLAYKPRDGEQVKLG